MHMPFKQIQNKQKKKNAQTLPGRLCGRSNNRKDMHTVNAIEKVTTKKGAN